jgi:Gram-negative bacterial TonB protein C-terminal
MSSVIKTIAAFAMVAALSAPGLAQALAATPSPPDDLFCPVEPLIVERLDSAGTRWLVGLDTHGQGGAASGTIALYDGNRRYDIPFRHALVADLRDAAAIATPIVVAFGAPVRIDSAVVTALGDPPEPCEGLYGPYPFKTTVSERGVNPYPASGKILARLRAEGAAAAPLVAPRPVDEPLPASCSQASVPATTLNAYAPDTPPLAQQQKLRGVVVILVTLASDDHTIGARVEATSDPIFNPAALEAANKSRFRTQTFRCRKVYASYLFDVTFSP